MESGSLHILSTYLKKWSYQDNRISVSFSYFTDRGYGRQVIDMRINAPQNMVNEFLNRSVYKIKESYMNHHTESDEIAVKLINETETQRKLNLFFSKILKEFNANKRSRGRVRMISSRSMDFYYNDFEYEPLSDQAKFYVHLNRGVNKMNGDLWSAAIEDLKIALTFNNDDPTANKYMAEALLKNQDFEEALPYFEKYAETEKSLKAYNDLAHAYIKLEKYQEAEKALKKMKKLDPDDLLVQMLHAQIAYLQGKPYFDKLDAIRDADEDWLREYMKKTWDYKLPGFGTDESKMWNAATASRYLGYDRPFDLTKRAFNDEIPCYFDSERGTIRFVKAELDHWVEIQNRYKIDGSQYKVFEDRLSKEELKIGNLNPPKLKKPKKVESGEGAIA
jgi:tetratricopeptide (TPR) repeat protein